LDRLYPRQRSQPDRQSFQSVPLLLLQHLSPFHTPYLSTFCLEFKPSAETPPLFQPLSLLPPVFACFEAYRRWQWAIIRVETEHLGGSDCYRVTRDPPLPYDPHHSDSDSGDDSDEGTARVQKERLDRGRRRTYGRLGGLFSRGRKGKAAGAEGDEEDIV
jgi:hypothetical protein